MTATIWGLIAGLTAVTAEYLYRTLPGPWLSYLWIWMPVQLVIGYAVYKLVTTPNTTLIGAFVVFAFSTALARLCVSLFLLHEQIPAGTWAAFCLLITARIVQVAWK